MAQKKLAVAYQNDSLPLFEILAACEGLCEPIWVVDAEDPAMRPLLPLLRRSGQVVDTHGATVEEVAHQVGAAGPDGVITFAEELPLAAAIAQTAGLRFHDPATAERLSVKSLQRQLFRQAGLPGPRFFPAGSETPAGEVIGRAREIGFPLVVKPEAGLGSRDTCRVDDESSLRHVLAEMNQNIVVEEMLTPSPRSRNEPIGDVLMVDSLVRAGEPEHIAVTGHFVPAEPFRGTGSFIPSHFDPDQTKEILRVTDAALDAVGVRDSYTNTDLVMTDDGPVVLEVNGRVGGQVPRLLEMLGVAGMTRDSVRFALGEAVRAQRLPPGIDRVSFCAMYHAPPEAERLVVLDGAADLRRLPGVTDLVMNKNIGDRIDWRQGTLSRLFTAYGMVQDHHELAALYDRIQRTVTPRYG